ncbi:MAG: WG repeat-containing protein [Mangrovibacterium sp.]
MNKKLPCLLFFSLFLICRGSSQYIEWIAKPRYDQIGQFHDGVAAVNVAGKWGYINSKGEEIVKPEYDLACDFNEGAGVIINSGLEVKAVADVNGRLNIPEQKLKVRSSTARFSDGLLLVTDGRKWGIPE